MLYSLIAYSIPVFILNFLRCASLIVGHCISSFPRMSCSCLNIYYVTDAWSVAHISTKQLFKIS